jgi:hypothetical protein
MPVGGFGDLAKKNEAADSKSKPADSDSKESAEALERSEKENGKNIGRVKSDKAKDSEPSMWMTTM